MVEASGERAVAIGGSARNVATGDHVTQVDTQIGHVDTQIGHATVLPAEAFKPVGALGERLVRLPAATRLFVGRERELALLDEALGATRVVAVHGLGGIGKSTLVAHWIRESAADTNPVWWITADSPTAIDAGLTGLAMAMQPELVDVLPPKALRERALQWLATHDGWLLVLDNVSDPAHVEPLRERVPGGHFVITSRRATGWHGTATGVDLDVLDTAHAVELFGRICPTGGTGVPDLVAELGNLPLAVEQAAAFCRETGTSAERYLEMLAAYPADMFAASAEGGDPERTVARVWRVTLDRLEEGDLSAVVLLSVLAWFAPDAIPRRALEASAQPLVLARGLGRLAAHSMISVQGDTIAVHRLVQAVVRTPGGEADTAAAEFIDLARNQAIRLLLVALPEDYEDVASWPVWRSLLPHVQALAARVAPDEDTDELGRLVNGAGMFLYGQQDMRGAVRLLERARDIAVRFLGPENISALAVASNLGLAYAAAGDPGHAISLMRQVREAGARVLGEGSPEFAVLLGNVGSVHYAADDLDTAIDLHARSVELLRNTVGRDDPRTFRSRGNLLNDLIAAGQGAQAVRVMEEYLEDAVRRYGEDHPATLNARNNLAGAYMAAGEFERAVELLRRNVAERERMLGRDHPQTSLSLNNLGGAYRTAGRLSEAISVYERALEGYARSLGENHPYTRRVRDNLSEAHEAVRRHENAPPE
ncbi:tetratricopeptide repeat protein [Streptomyces sp. CA-210063]|uniref:tetratricopeptide repeat protein n=1 Tax=Streptomyces sp. CA-210063 TaxID=2801029 RepID=UPI00214CD378|nr:tetratricopeptide repeat protein [Streptomyces sp. CA-210063]UUU32119.1 tetratricopeptide repeat protein [Streptomyces sp. CA-210063]